MAVFEQLWAVALIVVSIGVAVAFGWRQYRYLRRTGASPGQSEERIVLRRSARRRLAVSVMIGLCGVLIAATYLSGLDRAVVQIGEERQRLPAGDRPPLGAAELHDVQQYSALWIGVMVLLMFALTLIAVDIWDVRRHWRKSLRRLSDDRRAMLERQLARLRAERGASNGQQDGPTG
jgi:hypothetical protein